MRRFFRQQSEKLADTFPFDRYVLSCRRYATFQHVYEFEDLSFSQLQRLKLAQALYEISPLVVYLPYALLMMRSVAAANTKRKQLRVALLLCATIFPVECASVALQQKLYWPVVVDVYSEILEEKERRELKLKREVSAGSLVKQMFG